MAYRETVLLRRGVLTIELLDDLSYRLQCGEVVYEGNRKVVKGRSTPYAFRSVEQLRYDFEKDLADA